MKTNKRKRIPKGKTFTARKDKTNPSKKRKKKRNRVRGKEVTVREAASDAQIVYGRFKIGGNVTFIETSADSKAQLLTGTGRKQILFTARPAYAGSVGNTITVEIQVPVGTNPSIIVGVVGVAITIQVKTTAGASQSTANQVITAVQNSAAANALVKANNVHVEGDEPSDDGTGTVIASALTNLSGGGGTWLHQIITLAAHEIDLIEAVYIDNRLLELGSSSDPRWAINYFANRVFMAVNSGSDSQVAIGDLIGQLPTKWTDAHRQRGCAHVYMIMIWNANTFPEGYPEITFTVRGKKCYDPRTTLTAWTRNAALQCADYLTNTKWGGGFTYAEIDTDTLIAAANLCDETVTINDGTEPRFCVDGVFDSGAAMESVLEEFSAAMGGGDIVFQGGKWYIYPAKWRAPTITLTEDDAREAISFATHISRSDSFNSVRGTHPSTKADYNETDAPVVKNSTYITEDDGKQLFEDIPLTLVTSPTQAQRIFKIELERVRQGITVNFPCKLRGLLLQVADTVNLTIARLGWSAKTFEVRDVVLLLSQQSLIGVDLVLRESASGVYDWNNGEETTVDLSPDTDLPDPTTVAAPTSVTLASGTAELYITGDGTVEARIKVSWVVSVSEFVTSGGFYEIQFKLDADSVWSQSFNVPGDQTFHHLTDVDTGAVYDVRIRAVNTLSFTSAWVTVENHTVIGKTAPPSDVTNLTLTYTDQGIYIDWDAVADLDIAYYEVRYGGANWAAATFITQINANGSAYLYDYFSTVARTIRVKARDTSGNYSTNDATAVTAIVGPNPVQDFVVSTINANVLLDWTEPVPSTLSVNEYNVRRGTLFASSEFVGQVFGTFHALVEVVAGDYRYWVTAVDVGGNESTEVSVFVSVSIPDNFYAIESLNLNVDTPDSVEFEHSFIGTFEPAEYIEAGVIYLPFPVRVIASGSPSMPIYAFENFEQWFDNNGWTTLQDAIDDGFEDWLQPAIAVPGGYMQLQWDLGTLTPPSIVSCTWTADQLGEESLIVLTPSIQVSTDNVTWTVYSSTSQAFADAFRYLRLRWDFEGPNTLAYMRITNVAISVYLERDEEIGSVACNSGDSGGTTVTFAKDWFDVEDIQLTVEGTTASFPVLNFTDVVNPTSFKILVFDENGARASRTVRYRIRGALNQ